MIIACKCLNVLIEEENVYISNVDVGKLGLSLEEQRNPFFKEKLGSLCTNNISYTDRLFDEVLQLGAWSIHQCLICRSYTHAIHSSQPQQLLINLNLITTKEEVARLRQSDNYSPVFNVLLNIPTNDKQGNKCVAPQHPDLANLNWKLTKALQTELDNLEEAVRIFKERKYAEFEEFRERARRDHRIISSIFAEADVKRDNGALENNIRMDNVNTLSLSKDIGMLDAQMTNKIEQTPISSSFSTRIKSFANNNSNSKLQNLVNMEFYKEDSLDSEGIFDLEGTDPPHNGLNSDVYDSDTDDSVSRDEGIHISRGATQPWNSSIAKSLPVNVPAFTQFHDMSQERLDQHGEEPQDIAASIKALARSVHGDVFGELPRPRFSTQI